MFTKHLHNEVKMLLSLAKYDSAVLKNILQEVMKGAGNADVGFVHAPMFGCVDKTCSRNEVSTLRTTN